MGRLPAAGQAAAGLGGVRAALTHGTHHARAHELARELAHEGRAHGEAAGGGARQRHAAAVTRARHARLVVGAVGRGPAGCTAGMCTAVGYEGGVCTECLARRTGSRRNCGVWQAHNSGGVRQWVKGVVCAREDMWGGGRAAGQGAMGKGCGLRTWRVLDLRGLLQPNPHPFPIRPPARTAKVKAGAAPAARGGASGAAGAASSSGSPCTQPTAAVVVVAAAIVSPVPCVRPQRLQQASKAACCGPSAARMRHGKLRKAKAANAGSGDAQSCTVFVTYRGSKRLVHMQGLKEAPHVPNPPAAPRLAPGPPECDMANCATRNPKTAFSSKRKGTTSKYTTMARLLRHRNRLRNDSAVRRTTAVKGRTSSILQIAHGACAHTVS